MNSYMELFQAFTGVALAHRDEGKPRVQFVYNGTTRVVAAHDQVDADRIIKVMKDDHNIDAEQI